MVRTVLSGLFLACSWCWCIGMFFPVLMVRDFGWWGWVAFLVPNCLGAMMVGLIHRRGGAAARLIERHRRAAVAFSVVTILFHVSFLCWFVPTMLARHGIGRWAALGMVGVVVAMSVVVGRWWGRSRVWLWCGAGVFAVSVLCGVMAGVTGGEGTSFPVAPSGGGRFGLMSLAFLAPTVALGFLTCPHLDLTFLRVRRELEGRAGSGAFVIGFAMFFPVLMVMTLLYATRMAEGIACTYIVAHVMVQAWFTMGAHFRELMAEDGALRRSGRARWDGAGAFVFLCVVVSAVSVWALGAEPIGGMTATELVYKMFITAYGVVFPAYIWIVMVPRRGVSPGVQVMLLSCVIVVLPFAQVGYLGERWAWSLGIPGVILVWPWVGRLLEHRAPSKEHK